MKIKQYEYLYNGYSLNVTYEYEPALEGDAIDPAWGPVATIIEVNIDGSKHDAYEFINPAVIQSIEAFLEQVYE